MLKLTCLSGDKLKNLFQTGDDGALTVKLAARWAFDVSFGKRIDFKDYTAVLFCIKS